MPTEILRLVEDYSGTESQNRDAVYAAHTEVDFEEGICDVRIFSITSSSWLLSVRNRAEGGSRNFKPMFWVTLKSRNEDVVGPLHNSIDFTGVSGITLNLKVPHFLLADSSDKSAYKYNIMVSCCYERLSGAAQEEV
jgi:hypothetical protein